MAVFAFFVILSMILIEKRVARAGPMIAPGSIEAAFKGQLGTSSLDAEFTEPASRVIGLFGPSGSGKTTVLRCIAGLHRVANGYCALGGEVWQNGSSFKLAHRRGRLRVPGGEPASAFVGHPQFALRDSPSSAGSAARRHQLR
jgi:energy-coupling factor transporter ATP-binding protein EcfA2